MYPERDNLSLALWSTTPAGISMGSTGDSRYVISDYIITANDCMAPKSYGNATDGIWLNSAIFLDATLMAMAPELKGIADTFFSDILTLVYGSKMARTTARYKLKQVIKILLLNVYVGYLLGCPVRYSRTSNLYSKVGKKRYGLLFLTYRKVIASVDALISLGLIEHAKGFFDTTRKEGRQARLWASPRLIRIFHQVIDPYCSQQVTRDDRTEIIELRDIKKNRIGYIDTPHTHSMRDNLQRYNDFISGQDVVVQVGGSQRISLNNLNNRIFSNFISGNFTIMNLVVDKYNITSIQVPVLNSDAVVVKQYYSIATKEINNNHTYITHNISNYQHIIKELEIDGNRGSQDGRYYSTASVKSERKVDLPLFSVIIKKHQFHARKHRIARSGKMPLFYFGISQLEFAINNKKLHRVFNQGSFEFGGRFYGGGYQLVPKKFRPHILLNGEPTVELDYSAHHIRIAYHLEGIDYQDDPYMAMTDDDKERKIFKLLFLVILNAETEAKAISGFRNNDRKELFRLLGDLKDSTIKPLLARVKKMHPKIAHYIHSGKGVLFQNIDSKITEAILMRMTINGIPCLPIHDSYIVPKQYGNQLEEAMLEEYKLVMAFEPVIG